MKKTGQRYKFLYSSWVLSILPALFFILLVDADIKRYNIILEEKGLSYRNILAEDLNNDGITEIVRVDKGIPWYHILVTNNQLRIYDQWNFSDLVDPDLSGPFTGNFDNDIYKELYMFTYREDSLFINVNEFFETGGLRIDRRYLTRIGLINQKVTSSANPAGFYDLNGDGFGELYFVIYTGFGVDPRQVYCYDIVHDSLISSDYTGMIFQYPVLEDVDGDNRPEIFGNMRAAGNQKKAVPFTDWSAWLMVFNEYLEFEFQPLEFPGLTNQLVIRHIKKGDFSGYLVAQTNSAADSATLKPSIMLFSGDGRKIKERLCNEIGVTGNNLTTHISGSGRIFVTGDELVEIDTSLNIRNRAEIRYSRPFSSWFYDLTSDGSEEILLYHDKEKKLVVYDSLFHYLTETELQAQITSLRFNRMSEENAPPVYIIESDNNSYFIKVSRNRKYLLGYISYPGIYLGVVLFILLVRKITTVQIARKQELRQKLVTLQLQSIRAQLDPHFTFNTLNSVAALIYLQDKETACEYMNKFTRLLRSMIENTESIYRRLDEELEFVTTYLELEKLRFGEKFDFVIEIGEDVRQDLEVPKLILHTYAENAVKNGLMPRAEGGKLKIVISRENEYLKLCVEDNGVGRSIVEGQVPSTSKSIRLTNEFYEILNQINRIPIKCLITDLFNDSGQPSGTRAEVWIPASYEQRQQAFRI